MKRLHIFLLAGFALYSCSNDSLFDNDEDEDTVDYVFDTVTVLEYTPAPGQFINEFYVPADAADAARWAQETLSKKEHVSLGAFGGYIVLKPSHPIVNQEGYDFGIAGNPISTHNEPGIVWVSWDANGNGLADDQWYELKGSIAGTKDYTVTYYRTDEPGDVRWTDSRGREDFVAYVPAFHEQNYYPQWCDAEGSFTLGGTLLPSNAGEDGKNLTHETYGWGYADNLGNDMYTDENGRYLFNRFDLGNTVDAEGNPVDIDRADFIKVQSAVQYNLGHLGEVSTEVTGFVLLK